MEILLLDSYYNSELPEIISTLTLIPTLILTLLEWFVWGGGGFAISGCSEFKKRLDVALGTVV